MHIQHGELHAQVYTVRSTTSRYAALIAGPLASSPHSIALQLGAPDEAEPADCAGLTAMSTAPSDMTPTLRQMLCGLVLRVRAEGGSASAPAAEQSSADAGEKAPAPKGNTSSAPALGVGVALALAAGLAAAVL